MPEFEWSDDKADANVKKHGVSFYDATLVFDDPYLLEEEDQSSEYGEYRSRAVGLAGADLLMVVYTIRTETTRIISARRANGREEKNYRRNRGWA